MVTKTAELEIMEEQVVDASQNTGQFELSLGDLDMVAGGGVVDVFA